MLDPHQKQTGTRYTAIAALVIAAAVFSPAVLALTRPSGQAPIALAIAFSATCLAVAWLDWSKYARLTIPSIATAPSRVE